MTKWFRFYDEAIRHPKVEIISDRAFRRWVNLLCIASRNNGLIPHYGLTKLILTTRPDKLLQDIKELVNIGLLDVTDGGWTPHNWLKWQYKSDFSKDRMKRLRDGQVTVGVTACDDTRVQSTEYREQIQKESNKEDTPDGVAATKYFYESGTIKLTEKNYRQWEAAYTHIELRAELQSMAEWADQQGKNWFHAVNGLLGKKNRDARLRLDAVKLGMEAAKPDKKYFKV